MAKGTGGNSKASTGSGRERAGAANYGPRTGDDIKSVEDLRAFAANNQGRRGPDVDALPKKYQRWFNLPR
jgi:hypothetical protein